MDPGDALKRRRRARRRRRQSEARNHDAFLRSKELAQIASCAAYVEDSAAGCHEPDKKSVRSALGVKGVVGTCQPDDDFVS